ncbi:MAG TPA: cupredoxin family copper-binding protein [Terriglobales bacterium]|nr:cupredoxin family copper-binding protein [Terriglobales bacterium]
MKNKLLVTIASLALPLALAALFTIHPPRVRGEDANGTEIRADNFTFAPDTLTVPVNSTVTWVNKDDIPHVIASSDGVFKSKALDTDQKYSYTFTKAGTYPYYCSIHPKMVGKVVVQ